MKSNTPNIPFTLYGLVKQLFCFQVILSYFLRTHIYHINLCTDIFEKYKYTHAQTHTQHSIRLAEEST